MRVLGLSKDLELRAPREAYEGFGLGGGLQGGYNLQSAIDNWHVMTGGLYFVT